MYTTLNISSHEIKLAAVNGRKVKCWTSRTLEDGIVRDGRVLDPDALGQTIAQLFRTQKLPRNKVVAALSGLPYTYRIINFPPLKESQVAEAIMRALPDEFTIPVEDLYMSWSRLVASAAGTDYFILGVDRDLTDTFVQVMKLAGIRDWSMDLKPLALARAANASDAIIASLDKDHLDIVLVRDGHIKELHSAVPDQEGKKADFTRYMEHFVAELVKILSFHHDSAGTGESEKALTQLPILITGEVISPAEGEPTDEDKITAMMSKLTGHSVSLLVPPVSGPKTFNANAYATNIGLFLKTRHRQPADEAAPGRYHDVNLDIVSGRFAKKQVAVPMWYAVAPVIVFLVVFGAWSFNSAYSDNNAEINKLQTEMDHLTITHNQMQQQADQQSKSAAQVTTLEDTLLKLKQQHQDMLAGKGKDTVYIADVRSYLPPGGVLKEIRIGIDGLHLVGNVGDPFDVITYIRSLEKAGYTLNLDEINKGTDGGYSFAMVINTGQAQGGH